MGKWEISKSGTLTEHKHQSNGPKIGFQRVGRGGRGLHEQPVTFPVDLLCTAHLR